MLIGTQCELVLVLNWSNRRRERKRPPVGCRGDTPLAGDLKSSCSVTAALGCLRNGRQFLWIDVRGHLRQKDLSFALGTVVSLQLHDVAEKYLAYKGHMNPLFNFTLQ